MEKKAILALEDGRIYEGVSFGATGERYGEVVFNTGMTGYQEVLTDPSYKGQIVTMTYPLIGNYGINDEDAESRALWLEGFVINELCRQPSNWRSKRTLESYLKDHNVIGIQGVDTRALTKHIREAGAMRAAPSSSAVSTALWAVLTGLLISCVTKRKKSILARSAAIRACCLTTSSALIARLCFMMLAVM